MSQDSHNQERQGENMMLNEINYASQY